MVPNNRLHIVMVPGFAGFDALGQMGYYTGVTRQFQEWQQKERATRTVLHYFDNFPTAAVMTRAGRLHKYLAKRIARGTIRRGDALALVGHSTGGLDIRWLLWNLTAPRQKDSVVDGVRVSAEEIFQLVSRVVFLSVPQWGTNIADWVRSYMAGRMAVVAGLRAGVEASQLPLLDRVEDWTLRGANYLADSNLGRALQDALSEAEAQNGDNPARTADAHEAASELSLWLRHMASDFHAIDDLASQAPSGDYRSPAHFPEKTRTQEVARWGKRIQAQSYATLGKRPFPFDPGGVAPRWDLSNPWSYPEVAKDDTLAAGTDVAYRVGYRACAGGPFSQPAPNGAAVPRHLKSQQRQISLWHKSARMELWDNDGIVNTASMFWPDPRETVLVLGDHMDIVGHYKLVEVDQPSIGRKYVAYDLLASASGFGDDTFAEVWRNVFRFCATAL
jgi:triacylglycerol lipase